jgi:hypothetical protein
MGRLFSVGLPAIALAVCGTAAAAEPFARDLAAKGLSFHLSSPNTGSENKLRIVVDGLSAPSEPIERPVDGSIAGAAIADLDANGFPELFVFTQGAGSGSYGNVIGYASNRNKSISEIALPELSTKDARGYQGHDAFAVSGRALVRRFPIYRDGDVNAAPSGGERRISYRLRAGEATWRLEPVTSVVTKPGKGRGSL